MAAIVLRSFGGMAPSANDKTLADGMATYCSNLNLRHGDFRPLPVALDLGTPATPGLSLYRFESSGGFITNPNVVNYVRGPIPNDATERTYYTGDSYPKVVTQSGDVRRLGVPQPGAAPVASVNVVDEFSTDDAAASIPVKLAEVNAIMWGKLITSYTGLLDADIAALGFVSTPDPWRFRFAVAGTLASGVFTPTNAAHRTLMTDKLGFYTETVGLVTTGYVDVYLRGMKYAFDPSFSTALQAVLDPSDAAGVRKLIPAATADAIVDDLGKPLETFATARDAVVAKLKKLATEFNTLASTTSPSSAGGPAAVTGFYGKSTTNDQIERAHTGVAKQIRDAVRTFNISVV